MAMVVTGIKRVEHVTGLSNLQAAAVEFVEKFGVLPTQVDGQDVIGRCAKCEVFILDGSTYSHLDEKVRGPSFLDPDVENTAVICERCMRVAQAAAEDAANGVVPEPAIEVEDEPETEAGGEPETDNGFRGLE